MTAIWSEQSYLQSKSWGLNQSSLSKWFLLQNCMNIIILMEWHCVFQNRSLGFLQGLRSLKNWLLQKLWKVWNKNLNSSLKNGYFGAAAFSGLFLLIEYLFFKNFINKKVPKPVSGWSVIKDHTVERTWMSLIGWHLRTSIT